MTSTNHPLELLVRNLELRARLSPEDRDAILALPYTVRTLNHLAYTVREGDPPRECAVLLSGFAYRQKITGDGARQIIALHLPGDALDFQNLYLKVSDHSVQMLTRGDVATVQRAELQELARARPAVGHAILIKTLVEASIFREWVLNVGRRKARERMAHVLCELGSRMDAIGMADEHGYELPMTQEELADTLGLTPVHVNRTLKLLEAEGLITRNRRSIAFPDWEKIREVADFNDRYLHLDMQVPAPF
jgi:CRP-like cAMP-binding protein